MPFSLDCARIPSRIYVCSRPDLNARASQPFSTNLSSFQTQTRHTHGSKICMLLIKPCAFSVIFSANAWMGTAMGSIKLMRYYSTLLRERWFPAGAAAVDHVYDVYFASAIASMTLMIRVPNGPRRISEEILTARTLFSDVYRVLLKADTPRSS